MEKALEVVDVRVRRNGIVVTFSDGKVGGYTAALLAQLYAESKEIRNRQAPHGRQDGPSLVKKALSISS